MSTVATGTPVPVTYADNDPDDVATTDVYADLDGNLATTGDQYLLGTSLDEQDGTARTIMWDTAGIPEGAYFIVIVTNDGTNPAVTTVCPGKVNVWSTWPRDHTNILLKDHQGYAIQLTSTEPYSPRETCGACHDVDEIANGYHFQQGRTDATGALVMKDDFNNDGSAPGSSRPACTASGDPPSSDSSQLAGKTNANASSMDKTSFWWTGLCGICHPGGGPTELDRDGEQYYDAKTGQFGYEKLGKTAAQVTLDGDYAEINTSTGDLRAAPWDTTGVAQADCLFCHRADRVINGGMNMNWIWRTATLRAKDKLVDSAAGSVPAYAAASTAGQGWFSDLQMASTPAGQAAHGVQPRYRLPGGRHQRQPGKRGRPASTCWPGRSRKRRATTPAGAATSPRT